MNQQLKILNNTELGENAIQRLADIFVNLSNFDTMTLWSSLANGKYHTNTMNLHMSTGTKTLTGKKVTVCDHIVRVISEGYENTAVDDALTALEKRYLG